MRTEQLKNGLLTNPIQLEGRHAILVPQHSALRISHSTKNLLHLTQICEPTHMYAKISRNKLKVNILKTNVRMKLMTNQCMICLLE